MNHRLSLTAVIALVCLAGPAAAQGVNPVPGPLAPPADTIVAHVTQASMIDRPSAALRRRDLVAPAPLPASNPNLGEAKTEMIVGGAAFVAGALMDNDAGSVLMLGGAIVGLYGLWNYLK